MAEADVLPDDVFPAGLPDHVHPQIQGRILSEKFLRQGEKVRALLVLSRVDYSAAGHGE